jgi:hypothetical protein
MVDSNSKQSPDWVAISEMTGGKAIKMLPKMLPKPRFYIHYTNHCISMKNIDPQTSIQHQQRNAL